MNSVKAPLLSVVIPTCRRPLLLPRAIESALQSSPDGDVEVIVSPNGPDQAWKEVATRFDDPRVSWHPIAKAHANAARNLGLRVARGEFVRFLDDDDYLLEGASAQVREAQDRGLEICSGAVVLTSGSLDAWRVMTNSHDPDFVSNILGPRRKTGLQFYVYRTRAIAGFTFDETVPIGQDTHWTHGLCRARDWSWASLDIAVCAWVQHMDNQVSHAMNYSAHMKLQERFLWETIQSLHRDSRLTESRRTAAARGMWDLIHRAYYLSPRHWSAVLKKTQRFFPSTYPELPIYQHGVGRLVDPEVLERMMVPKRWLNHMARRLASPRKTSPW